VAGNLNDELASLPPTFRYVDARRSISDRRLRHLRAAGLIEQVARGIYRRSDAAAVDEDLVEVAMKQQHATICLGTALAKHGLSDEIPGALDIAVPRDTWRPATRVPVRWHSFARDTFDLGRERLELDESTHIGLYSAERSIVDAFRLRHFEGSDQAYEALKRWLRRGGQPASLLRMAKPFPKAGPALRQALEILL